MKPVTLTHVPERLLPISPVRTGWRGAGTPPASTGFGSVLLAAGGIGRISFSPVGEEARVARFLVDELLDMVRSLATWAARADTRLRERLACGPGLPLPRTGAGWPRHRCRRAIGRSMMGPTPK